MFWAATRRNVDGSGRRRAERRRNGFGRRSDCGFASAGAAAFAAAAAALELWGEQRIRAGAAFTGCEGEEKRAIYAAPRAW